MFAIELLKVEEAACSSVRRRRCVALTKEGAARLAAALPQWEEAQARFERKFGERAGAELRTARSAIMRERSFVV